MLTGATVAQLLPLLALPIITRLYTPDEIGVFAVFQALFIIITAFMSARYEYAILLSKKDTDAEQIFYLALGFSILTTLATLFVILVWGVEIARLFGSAEYVTWLYLLPASIFGYSVFNVGSYYLNRFRQYKSIAFAKVSQASGMSVIQVALGYFRYTTFGMIIGKLIGDILIALITVWQLQKLKYAFRAGVSYERIRFLAKKYRSFPLYNAPHALFNTLSNNAAILVYTRHFDEAATGFYALAVKFTFGPIHLITKSLMQVFSREISERFNNQEDISHFFNRTVGTLALAGIGPTIIAWVISPDLFALLLGSDYRVTGEMIRLILPWVFMVMVVSPVTFIPMLLNRQRRAMLIDFIYMLSRFGALYAGVAYESITIAIAGYSAIGVVIQLYLLLWIRSLVRNTSVKSDPYVN